MSSENAYLIKDGKREEEVKLGCCGRCSRFMVTWSNILLFLCGLILIGLGSYEMNEDLTTWIGTELLWAIIIFGILVVLLSLIGWCSAQRNSVCGLTCYSIIMILIIVGELVIIIMFIYYSTHMRSFLESAWNNLSASEQAKIKDEFNCGSFDDCYDDMKDKFTQYSKAGIIILSVILIYELAILLFSCCLIKGVRKSKQVRVNIGLHEEEEDDDLIPGQPTTGQRYQTNYVGTQI